MSNSDHSDDSPFALLMEYLISLVSGMNNGSLSPNETAVILAINQLSPTELEILYNASGARNADDLLYLLNKSIGVRQGRNQDLHLSAFHQYNLSQLLLLYVSPVILIVGTLGNAFSFVVLRRKPMAKVSSYIYLATLAVTDTVVLYIGLLRLWLTELIGIDYHSTSNWACKLCVLIGYGASNLSVWLIIAVTVERFIVVCFPFRANVMCNVSRAKKVIGFLTCLILAIYFHFLWTVTLSSEGKCDAAVGFSYLVRTVWPWVDAGIYSFFPFVIIMILNILIIKEIKGAQTNRVQLRASDYGSSNVNFQSLNAPDRRQQQTGERARLTVMLLTVSFTFLLLTVPVNIVLIITKYWNQNIRQAEETTETYRQVAAFRLAKAIIELLMYTNHSINFFLYCATGHKFRQQVLLLFRCLRRISCCPTANGSGNHALRKTSASIMGQLSDMTQTSRYGRRKSSSISLDVLETRLHNNSSTTSRDDSSAKSCLEVQVKMVDSCGKEVVSNCTANTDSDSKKRFPSSPQTSGSVRKLVLTIEDGSSKKKGHNVRSYRYSKNGFKKTKSPQLEVPAVSPSTTGCRVLYSSKKINSAPVQRRMARRYPNSEQYGRDDEFNGSLNATHNFGLVASSQF